MMKQYLFLLFALLPPFSLTGQIYPVDTAISQITFEVVAPNNKLQLQPKNMFLSKSKKEFPPIDSIQLVGADLVLQFHYKGNKKKFSPNIIKILSLAPDGGKPFYPGPKDTLSEFNSLSKKEKKGKQVWMDAVENRLELGQTYHLSVQRTIFDFVDCQGGVRPEFTLKKQLPHYGGFILSAAFFGLSRVYNNQKDDLYDDYLDAWRDGLAEDPDLYTKVQDKEDQYKGFSDAALYTFGANAIYFIGRYYYNRTRGEKYDKYCAGIEEAEIQLVPSLTFHESDMPSNSWSLGLSMNWRF